MNVRRFAGVPAMVMHSVGLTQASSTHVVRCHESSVHTAGRGSCSVAMALGVAQQRSRMSAAYLRKLCPVSTAGTTPHVAHMAMSTVWSTS